MRVKGLGWTTVWKCWLGVTDSDQVLLSASEGDGVMMDHIVEMLAWCD